MVMLYLLGTATLLILIALVVAYLLFRVVELLERVAAALERQDEHGQRER